MRIGIRAQDMEKVPFEKMVENIGKRGFYCTQLDLQKDIHDFNVNPGTLTPGMAFYMKDIFAKNKVEIAILECYFNLTNPIDSEWKKIREVYKSQIRFASLLGCGMVGTKTGSMKSDYSFRKSNHSEAALEIFIEKMKRIVDYAENMGVILGIEPVYTHIVSDLDRTYRVLTEVNSPNLQVILDPVNLLSYDNYKEQDDIIKGAFSLFGKDIAAIQAKDFKVADKTLEEVPAGRGILNYPLLMSLVKKHKPFVHVILKKTKPEDELAVKDYVENTYDNLTMEEV
ncbi:MAG: AP-endonuc-2 domain-containing protein [Lachnoclostridium sp.]|jgi:L-ribulose-5-phosphate 3-epimerase